MYANKSFARQSFSQSFAVTIDFFAVFPVLRKFYKKKERVNDTLIVVRFNFLACPNALQTTV
jgi:hypothetical protein